MKARGLKLALVLWNGNLGGAEAVKAMVAREWRRWDVEASVVFVTEGTQLVERLERDGVPHVSVGLSRGRAALAHPRRLARVVSAVGPDGALLVDSGYLAAALRAGGYRGRVVGVEHGKLLASSELSRAHRLRDHLERATCARFRAIDVGVSDFMVDEIRRHPHARRLCRIYNGVDTQDFMPAPPHENGASRTLRAGAAARLVPGKGIDQLLRAVAELRDVPLRLEIAGDGPERPALVQLTHRLEIEDVVTFRGPLLAMPEFWRASDIAIVPSVSAESFSMATLEAMASGLPVVATRIGGIPEVLADGETGTIVPPGDPAALAGAIRAYAADPGLRRRHAVAAQARARRSFGIEATAAQYLTLFAGASS